MSIASVFSKETLDVAYVMKVLHHKTTATAIEISEEVYNHNYYSLEPEMVEYICECLAEERILKKQELPHDSVEGKFLYSIK